MKQPDFSNLQACIEEAKTAALDTNPGPADPTDYRQLLIRLEAARDKLPPLYREKVFQPIARTLDELSESGFAELLKRDPNREREA
ncbi:MAG: hypothetical protein ACOYIL_14640, partial [Brevibacillus sp.]